MNLLISAAETSSDIHGSHLLKALQSISPSPIQAFGMGGPNLERAGLDCQVNASELLSMGFTELIARLPKILAAEKKLLALARERRPDLAIVIDYPDFHMRLARKLKKLGIPVVYFIPPKVWAWRKYRINILRKYFSKVLSILPFEVGFYEREKLDVTYVGSPLLDELPMSLTRAEARLKLGLTADEPVLLLMPGSRPAEIKRHLPIMLTAVEGLVTKLLNGGRVSKSAPLKVLVPLPETQKDRSVIEGLRNIKITGLDLRVLDASAGAALSAVAMKAADYGIVKSGTSTLRSRALMDCAHFIIYRASALSEFIFHYLVRYRGPVGLSNLVFTGLTDEKPVLVRELLAQEANPDAVASELNQLVFDPAYGERMRLGFKEVRRKIQGDLSALKLSPSERAAQEVIQTWQKLQKARANRISS